MSHYYKLEREKEEGERGVKLKKKERKLIGRGSCIVNGNEGYNKI